MFLSNPVSETFRCAAQAAIPATDVDTGRPWFNDGMPVKPVHVMLWQAGALADKGIYALIPVNGEPPLMCFLCNAHDGAYLVVFPIAFVPDMENAEELVRAHAERHGIRLRDLAAYEAFDQAAAKAMDALEGVVARHGKQEAEKG